MAVHDTNREPHASSLTEFRPKMESVSSIQRRAHYHHRKDYAYRCSFVPLLLILTLVTGLTKLTYYCSQHFVDISDCFLLVGDLRAHRSHNTTQWPLSSQGVGRHTAYFMPVSTQPPEPLSQLVSNPLTTIPSLSMAVNWCASPCSPSVNTQRSALCLLITTLSGDVQTNPGPIKYPCHTCHRPVANNHRAMGCENCGVWVHIKCGGVTPKQYEAYQRGDGLAEW